MSHASSSTSASAPAAAAWRPSPGLALALAVASALAATCWGILGYMDESPAAFAFAPARQHIPDALVRSDNVPLAGFRGPLVARAGGAAETIWVNGRPVGPRAEVGPGDRIALAVRAPSFYDDTAIGTVRVGGRVAEFRVGSLRRPPPARLEFEEVAVAPGRVALSGVVAPRGFAPGTPLTVEPAAARVQIETREGRLDPPVALPPGEPFRLVTRVPHQGPAPIEIRVTIGDLRGTWTIHPAR